jgi:tetratricopeptide (TPR) repeat protein
MGLALINKEKGKYSEALASLEVLLESGFKSARIYTEIAGCYMKLGQPQMAEEFLASAPKGKQGPRIGAGYNPDKFRTSPR